MSAEKDEVLITLNNQGTDILVSVSMETANRLLNDPQQADEFVKNLIISETEEPESEIPETEELETEEPETEEDSSASGPSSASLVWTARRPTAKDHDATEYFLTLRSNYSRKFDDRKTVKSQVWNQIAKDMSTKGYDLGPGGPEKCRQKWANLQKQYLAFLKYTKTTGTGKRRPPPYFEKIHSILGNKDKCSPQHLQDSEEATSTCSETELNENSGSSIDSSAIKTRFSSKNNKEKPKSSKEKIIEMLKEQYELDRQDRETQCKNLQKLIEEQNKQRAQFLELFAKSLQKPNPGDNNE